MHDHTSVFTFSMSRVQAVFTGNAVLEYQCSLQRELKRLDPDSPEYRDYQKIIAAMRDLHGTLITGQTHTFAALKMLDDGSVEPLLEEADHV